MAKSTTTEAKIAFGALLAMVLLIGAGASGAARADALTAPTPGPNAMTVYSVTNSSSLTINVQHVFNGPGGFSYSFWSQVPAGQTVVFHVANMPQIPSPFQGTVTLYGSQPFTAQIVGYDYPMSGSLVPRAWLPYVTNRP